MPGPDDYIPEKSSPNNYLVEPTSVKSALVFEPTKKTADPPSGGGGGNGKQANAAKQAAVRSAQDTQDAALQSAKDQAATYQDQQDALMRSNALASSQYDENIALNKLNSDNQFMTNQQLLQSALMNQRHKFGDGWSGSNVGSTIEVYQLADDQGDQTIFSDRRLNDNTARSQFDDTVNNNIANMNSNLINFRANMNDLYNNYHTDMRNVINSGLETNAYYSGNMTDWSGNITEAGKKAFKDYNVNAWMNRDDIWGDAWSDNRIRQYFDSLGYRDQAMQDYQQTDKQFQFRTASDITKFLKGEQQSKETATPYEKIQSPSKDYFAQA